MASKSKRRKKVSSGTKDNLNTIIDELSIVISRKNISPDSDNREALTSAFNNSDAHIAAIGLVLPDVDLSWRESGARNAFLKIKRKRQNLMRMYIGIAIAISAIVIAGSVLAVIFIEGWTKYIILIAAALLLLLGSFTVPRTLVPRAIKKFENEIPIRFETESNIINQYIKELILLLRKM
ncbi:MAG: hypothetical protein FK734_13050 [Asgard group archaeon]|nr:hypothetical protein [Asgard group archaeon]